MRASAWIVVAGALVAVACGGKVTFVEDGTGAGGDAPTSTSATTAKASSSTGAKPTCDELRQDFVDAVVIAQQCDPKLDIEQCSGVEILLDSCDCPSLVLNETHPADVKAAKDARAKWIGAGCPTLDCGGCFEAQAGSCDPAPGAPSGGMCVGYTLN